MNTLFLNFKSSFLFHTSARVMFLLNTVVQIASFDYFCFISNMTIKATFLSPEKNQPMEHQACSGWSTNIMIYSASTREKKKGSWLKKRKHQYQIYLCQWLRICYPFWPRLTQKTHRSHKKRVMKYSSLDLLSYLIRSAFYPKGQWQVS